MILATWSPSLQLLACARRLVMVRHASLIFGRDVIAGFACCPSLFPHAALRLCCFVAQPESDMLIAWRSPPSIAPLFETNLSAGSWVERRRSFFLCEFAVSGAWSEEETDNPVYADTGNFFKVEEWTADDLHVARLSMPATGSTRRALPLTPP